jgi:transketolase N-terminal domain/subunit
MTQDEIIEMAKQAGFKMENSAAIQAAETFAKLVAAKALVQRTWVGLTDDEISALSKGHIVRSTYAKAIEAKLKEKNS